MLKTKFVSKQNFSRFGTKFVPLQDFLSCPDVVTLCKGFLKVKPDYWGTTFVPNNYYNNVYSKSNIRNNICSIGSRLSKIWRKIFHNKIIPDFEQSLFQNKITQV